MLTFQIVININCAFFDANYRHFDANYRHIAKRLNFDDIIYMSYSIDFRRKVIFTMEEEGL
ncbi:hypothetical protein, partial [Arsenophonus endosymbiont of Bemisia tabaci]|uniref:hypothetical protein n=1 Tax=Arsenophonus endosymbiont of Bemisia tabaci TaxID=536059 RepID=UPI0015F6E813